MRVARTYEVGIGATTSTLLTKAAWESLHDVGVTRNPRAERIGEDMIKRRPRLREGRDDNLAQIRAKLMSTVGMGSEFMARRLDRIETSIKRPGENILPPFKADKDHRTFNRRPNPYMQVFHDMLEVAHVARGRSYLTGAFGRKLCAHVDVTMAIMGGGSSFETAFMGNQPIRQPRR